MLGLIFCCVLRTCATPASAALAADKVFAEVGGPAFIFRDQPTVPLLGRSRCKGFVPGVRSSAGSVT